MFGDGVGLHEFGIQLVPERVQSAHVSRRIACTGCGLEEFFQNRFKNVLFDSKWLSDWKMELVRKLRALIEKNTIKMVKSDKRTFYVYS